jgi:hypothetical protein
VLQIFRKTVSCHRYQETNIGFAGQDSFTFVILDSKSLASPNKATISINVNPGAESSYVIGNLAHKVQTSPASSTGHPTADWVE